MTQTIITAGDASTGLVTAAGNDGTLVLQSGPAGGKVNALSIDAGGNVTPAALIGGKQLVLATAVASTSGTFIDFTGIPSWAKRITVLFNSVSTNGTSLIQLQLGSGSIVTTGYSSSGSVVATGVGSSSSTTGLLTSGGTSDAAGTLRSGVITLAHVGGNLWVMSSVLGETTATTRFGGGSVQLGGALDRVRVTTVNGTDLFDFGSINIMWE